MLVRNYCTTAKRHIDAICHNRRYMSQMAIQNVTIDAKYHNLTLNVTTLYVTKISFFSSKCHNKKLSSNRQDRHNWRWWDMWSRGSKFLSCKYWMSFCRWFFSFLRAENNNGIIHNFLTFSKFSQNLT